MTSLEKIEFFEKNSDFNYELMTNVRMVFDQAIVEHNYGLLCDVPAMLDSDRLMFTGEIRRIYSILRIVTKESDAKVSLHFLSDVSDYESLYNKYLKTVIMLRRIELYPDSAFAIEAYDFIRTISFEAVSNIITEELYERRFDIVCAIINEIVDSADIKLKWLLYLINDYKYEWLYLEIASTFLDYGMIDNALNYLTQIEAPSDSTKNLVEELWEASKNK